MAREDDPRLVPLRKLIADVAREVNGTIPDEDGPLGCPITAELDDVGAERIALAVLEHVSPPIRTAETAGGFL